MNSEISIITSTYYRNDLLREAIESVLEQDYEPVEYVVIDDSGEGYATPILEEYDEVTPIIRDEEAGWARTYTQGVEESTGKYIQFLDDDDYLLEGKLKKTATILQRNPDVGVSYCGVVRGDEGCFLPDLKVSGDILKSALRFQTFPLWTGSMLMERSVLEDCLPLAEYAGDTDLKIELARRTEFDYVDECLAYYRRDQSRKWVGPKRFEEVRRVLRNQAELYDEYPEIRRQVLKNWYQRQGMYWLEERMWSPKAINCFARSVYYADGKAAKFKSSVGTIASLFGRPGWVAATSLQDAVRGSGTESRARNA